MSGSIGLGSGRTRDVGSRENKKKTRNDQLKGKSSEQKKTSRSENKMVKFSPGNIINES